MKSHFKTGLIVVGTLCISWPATTMMANQVGDTSTDKTADNIGLVGYDHSKQVQKKLLEFVKPIYKEPLVSSQMIVGLSKVGSNEKVSAERKLAANRISLAATSMTELQFASRIEEQYQKLQELHSKGHSGPGMRSLDQASGLLAQSFRDSTKAQALIEELQLLKVRSAVSIETRKLRAYNKLESVRLVSIEPATAQSGHGLNVLLNAIKPILSSASTLSALDPAIFEILDEQKITSSEIEKIQLQLDGDGVPLIFSAAQGSSGLTNPPFKMQHPELLAQIQEIESSFNQLRAESPKRSMYDVVGDLNQKLDALDSKSEEVIGSGHFNAKKGHVQYRAYELAKEYRTRLRSIVNRMLIEGNANFLRIPQGKFDSLQHGNRVVDFVKFVVDSGCKFAPAIPGNAPTYARLQRSMLEMQMLLEVEPYDYKFGGSK